MTIFLKPKPFLGLKVYRFKDPDTGFKFQAETLAQICKHIREYRRQNTLEPIDFLEDAVMHFSCMLKENLGACERSPDKLKRGVHAFIKGGVSLLKNLLYSSFASQEVADKRSLICKNCVLNVFPDKGPFIAWADSIAVSSTGGKRSMYHDDLGNCSGCSCPLRAKVFYNGKIELKNSEENLMRLSNLSCWQLPENKGKV